MLIILFIVLVLLLIISLPIFLLIFPYIIIFVGSYILITIITISIALFVETGKLGEIYEDNFFSITFVLSLVFTILLRYHKYDTFSWFSK